MSAHQTLLGGSEGDWLRLPDGLRQALLDGLRDGVREQPSDPRFEQRPAVEQVEYQTGRLAGTCVLLMRPELARRLAGEELDRRRAQWMLAMAQRVGGLG